MKTLQFLALASAIALMSCGKETNDPTNYPGSTNTTPVVIPDGNFLGISTENGSKGLFSYTLDSVANIHSEKIVSNTAYEDWSSVFSDKAKGLYMAMFDSRKSLFAYDVTAKRQVPGRSFVNPIHAPVELGGQYYALEEMENRFRLVRFDLQNFNLTVLKDSITGVNDTEFNYSCSDGEHVYFMCNGSSRIYRYSPGNSQLYTISGLAGATFFNIDFEKKGSFLTVMHEPGGMFYLTRLELTGSQVTTKPLMPMHSFHYFGSPETGTFDPKTNTYFYCCLVQQQYVLYRMNLTKNSQDGKFMSKAIIGLESMN